MAIDSVAPATPNADANDMIDPPFLNTISGYDVCIVALLFEKFG